MILTCGAERRAFNEDSGCWRVSLSAPSSLLHCCIIYWPVTNGIKKTHKGSNKHLKSGQMIANENSPSPIIFQTGSGFSCNCFTEASLSWGGWRVRSVTTLAYIWRAIGRFWKCELPVAKYEWIVKEKQTYKEKQGPVKTSRPIDRTGSRNISENRKEETLIIFRATIPWKHGYNKRTIW